MNISTKNKEQRMLLGAFVLLLGGSSLSSAFAGKDPVKTGAQFGDERSHLQAEGPVEGEGDNWSNQNVSILTTGDDNDADEDFYFNSEKRNDNETDGVQREDPDTLNQDFPLLSQPSARAQNKNQRSMSRYHDVQETEQQASQEEDGQEQQGMNLLDQNVASLSRSDDTGVEKGIPAVQKENSKSTGISDLFGEIDSEMVKGRAQKTTSKKSTGVSDLFGDIGTGQSAFEKQQAQDESDVQEQSTSPKMEKAQIRGDVRQDQRMWKQVMDSFQEQQDQQAEEEAQTDKRPEQSGWKNKVITWMTDLHKKLS